MKLFQKKGQPGRKKSIMKQLREARGLPPKPGKRGLLTRMFKRGRSGQDHRDLALQS